MRVSDVRRIGDIRVQELNAFFIAYAYAYVFLYACVGLSHTGQRDRGSCLCSGFEEMCRICL